MNKYEQSKSSSTNQTKAMRLQVPLLNTQRNITLGQMKRPKGILQAGVSTPLQNRINQTQRPDQPILSITAKRRSWLLEL